jgi:hypothetical protein
MLVAQMLEAEVHAGWEQPDEHVQVEEVRGPGCGLMLRHRRDDGNVNLGVARVPEGVESPAPGSDVAKIRQGNQASCTNGDNGTDDCH